MVVFYESELLMDAEKEGRKPSIVLEKFTQISVKEIETCKHRKEQLKSVKPLSTKGRLTFRQSCCSTFHHWRARGEHRSTSQAWRSWR